MPKATGRGISEGCSRLRRTIEGVFLCADFVWLVPGTLTRVCQSQNCATFVPTSDYNTQLFHLPATWHLRLLLPGMIVAFCVATAMSSLDISQGTGNKYLNGWEKPLQPNHEQWKIFSRPLGSNAELDLENNIFSPTV
eukprot:Gb_36226 [translate_table: standard]